MSLLDIITGGKSDAASEAMRKAQEAFSNVSTPTKKELTLPELQQYVNSGAMTPAQAQAYLQDSNAFNTENTPQTGTAAQIAALNQLAGVANAGAEGTPVEQAQVQNVMNQMNTAIGGQRGAIEQGMQARGTPAGLVQAALENQTVGQNATAANQAALQAQSQAYQTALNAMSQGASAGNALQGQQNTQANTVANAQNAMQQFNAANQQNASEANAGRAQQANEYNTANKQNIANQNTGLSNQRTTYNAQVPQTMFNNSMQKASGEAGAYQKSGDLAQQQGQQNAGIWSGVLKSFPYIGSALGGAAGGAAGGAGGAGSSGPVMSASGYSDGYGNSFAHGGIIPCMDEGGLIPGQSEVPGDSVMNDKVPIMTSPGEAVIPKTQTQEHLPQILSMLSGHDQQPEPEPEDVALVIRALRNIRLGAA